MTSADEPAQKLQWRQVLKRDLKVIAVFLAIYVVLYVPNSCLGGYDPHWASDGRRSYSGGLLMHDCVLWQPYFGRYYNEYRWDWLGDLFYPLIRLDQAYFHPTRRISDPDIEGWFKTVTETDIHPEFREAFREAKSKGDSNSSK